MSGAHFRRAAVVALSLFLLILAAHFAFDAYYHQIPQQTQVGCTDGTWMQTPTTDVRVSTFCNGHYARNPNG